MLTGDQEYEYPSTTADKDIESYTGWVDATADFGMFYAGGSIAYVSGDGDASDDKVEDVHQRRSRLESLPDHVELRTDQLGGRSGRLQLRSYRIQYD